MFCLRDRRSRTAPAPSPHPVIDARLGAGSPSALDTMAASSVTTIDHGWPSISSLARQRALAGRGQTPFTNASVPAVSSGASHLARVPARARSQGNTKKCNERITIRRTTTTATTQPRPQPRPPPRPQPRPCWTLPPTVGTCCGGGGGGRAVCPATWGAGGAGDTPAAKAEPHTAQNLCSAAVRGAPQVGQKPNPVDIMSVPFDRIPSSPQRTHPTSLRECSNQ